MWPPNTPQWTKKDPTAFCEALAFASGNGISDLQPYQIKVHAMYFHRYQGTACDGCSALSLSFISRIICGGCAALNIPDPETNTLAPAAAT